MKVTVFIASIFAVQVSGLRLKRAIGDIPTKEEMLKTNRYEYFENKVNQLAGISCDLCVRAIYGVNYDFIKMKDNVLDMITLDCEALFHERPDEIDSCIQFMSSKVKKYSNKVEKLLDSRRICALLRVCPAIPEKKDKKLFYVDNKL